MLFTWMWPDGVIEPVSWEFGENGMNISYSLFISIYDNVLGDLLFDAKLNKDRGQS